MGILFYRMLELASGAQSGWAFAVVVRAEVLKWKLMFGAEGFVEFHVHVLSLYYKLANSYNL